MSLLTEKTIKDFNNLLASSEPAPGGGSTAALSGLFGTALSMMVVNLSIGKKSYEALDNGIKEKIRLSFETIKTLNDELLELIDEDTRAFNTYMEAMKLNKETEEEKAVRAKAIQKASMYVLEIPLKVAGKCLNILRNQMVIAQHGNKNAVSDVGVGVLLAHAGLEGAALNVRINLPGINDTSVRRNAEERIEGFLNEGGNLKTQIMDMVIRRIG